MSDNIPPDEVERRLILFLRIPTEVWTDVLKLLPRRNLVQNISPACYRLKEISNKNVKCVHVIENLVRFCERLQANVPGANQQMNQHLIHLAGHKCQLSDQFRLTEAFIIEKNKAILRHCVDLFRGCRLSLLLVNDKQVEHIFECLNYLKPAKPFANITIRDGQPGYADSKINLLLRHPYIWDCTRIVFEIPTENDDYVPPTQTIFDWLHHQPTGVDGGSDGADEQVRCLTIQYSRESIHEAIDWLINHCVQNFQQSQDPEDRRRFVLSFSNLNIDEITQFEQFERRHQNQRTGEVLIFEPDGVDEYNQFALAYRLRRCLAEEAANGEEFYAKTFKRDSRWEEDSFVDNDEPTVHF